jgi:hypothetical protein
MPITNVGLKDRPVYGWAKSPGRHVTATEFECAGCERAVRYVYLTMDGCWLCQECSGLTWNNVESP